MEARATGKRIFIGSSQEARKVVDRIARCLERDGHSPQKWMSLFERPGQYNLEELTACAESVDGAIFVFTPDLEVTRRNKTEWMPCPNVVLEFGLFLSRLGRERSIQISMGDLGPISDLDGIVPLKIDRNRAKRRELDEDAQQRLKKWAKGLPNRQHNSVATIETFPIERFKRALSKANLVRILQTFMPYDQHFALFKDELKTVVNAGRTVHVLLCNPGSCACLIRGIALHRGYEKVREEVPVHGSSGFAAWLIRGSRGQQRWPWRSQKRSSASVSQEVENRTVLLA